MYYGLSFPKNFSDEETVCYNLLSVYQEFKDNFLMKENRPKLNNVFIFIQNYEQFGINKRFLHSVSIKDKYYYNSYPCVNDLANVACRNMCNVQHDNNIHCVKSIDRATCYYRLARIHWVPEIIKLANSGDPNIKVWSKTFRDTTTGQWDIKKKFVWYKQGLGNFIIIFEEKYRGQELYCLKFITGYPVFGRRAETDFSEDYNDYINKKTGPPVRVRMSPSTLGR